MIRLVDARTEPLFRQVIDTFDIFSIKIYAQYSIYGLQSRVLDCWLIWNGDRPIGAVSRLEGRLTVSAGEEPDPAELAAFLSAVGGGPVEGRLPLLSAVQAHLGGALESSCVMRYVGPPPPPDPEIQRAESLTGVYRLLCAANPGYAREAPYEAWLTEASHKSRHGLADFYTLSVDSGIVCTDSIFFTSPGRAVLALLATAPRARGNGYARRMMRHVTGEALRQGREPWLLTAEDALADFHARCGYQTVDRWGSLTLR